MFPEVERHGIVQNVVQHKIIHNMAVQKAAFSYLSSSNFIGNEQSKTKQKQKLNLTAKHLIPERGFSFIRTILYGIWFLKLLMFVC